MDKKSLESLLKDAKREELVELIGLMVKTGIEAEKALLSYCKRSITTDEQELIVKKQLLYHWKIAGTIIIDANMYGGCCDKDEEEAFENLEAIISLVEEHNVSWTYRRKILDEILEEVKQDNSIFTDYLVDVTIKLCETNEEKEYLADFLSVNGNSYYRSYAGRLYLALGKDEKYLETIEKNLIYGSDYLELAKFHFSKGRLEVGMEKVMQGLERADGRLDEIYTFLFKKYKKGNDVDAMWNLYHLAYKKKRNVDTIVELMYDYGKENNDYELQKEMLLKVIYLCDSRSIFKWFKCCQSELSKEDWVNNETSLLKELKHRDTASYLELCLSKGNTREVIDYLKEKQQFWGFDYLDKNHKFSKRLAGEYPKEVVALYKKEVAYFVGLGKEKNYIHATSVLRKIRSIMRKNKWNAEWDSYFFRFKEEHKRKRLLVGHLTKLE